MRSSFIPQMPIDGQAIEEIEFDLGSRHKLVAILMALQYVYKNARQVLDEILQLIQKDLCEPNASRIGRKGLSFWESLVFAAIRLGCNFDYDHLADEGSHHKQLRAFLGLGLFDNKQYKRSTIHENLNRLKTRTLDKINELIVGIGHSCCDNPLERVRGDSFVLKKNIHHPTDSSLIVDGIRKMVEISHKISEICRINGWRDHEYYKRKAKRILRRIGSNARSKKADKDTLRKSLYLELMELAAQISAKAEMTAAQASVSHLMKTATTAAMLNGQIDRLQYFMLATDYVCDLARRRVINDEQIPNCEKRFSLFEPDTELINRGKFPVPIEFGHRVLVIEDATGFILHCRQMGMGFTDEKVVVEAMLQLQQRYNGAIKACSFDKGFWTPHNLTALQEIVDLAVLPKKGGLSEADRAREDDPDFKQARQWHSGIESRIHSLVSANGLDCCRDKGPFNYRRYLAMAVLGRNLLTFGRILIAKERERKRFDDPLLALAA